jgi:O-antigen/teichoic acid export membrane protein
MAAAGQLRELRRRLLERDVILYSGFMALAMAAAMAKNLVFARLLHPQGFGVYTLALLLSAVGNYAATAGILDGLFREIPILRGQGSTAALQATRNAGVTASLMLGAVAGVLLSIACAAAEWWQPDLDGLVWAGPMLVGTVALNTLMLDLRTRERSSEYGALLFAKSAVAIALIAPLVQFGAAGAVAAETVAMLACAAWCRIRWSDGLQWAVGDRAVVITLMKRGLPFTGGSVLQNLAMSADRWAVQLRFGSATLGRYAFAMLISSLGLIAINVLQQYAGPRILRAYGATGDRVAVVQKATWLMLILAAVFALAAVPVIVGFRWLVASWYPQYAGAEQLVLGVYAGTVFMTLGFFDILFFAHGDGRWLMVTHGIVLAAQVLAYVAAAALSASLETYVIIFAAGRLLSLLLGWTLGLRMLRPPREVTA